MGAAAVGVSMEAVSAFIDIVSGWAGADIARLSRWPSAIAAPSGFRSSEQPVASNIAHKRAVALRV